MSITKEGRHKFNRDFKMNTTQQNEKAYTTKRILVEVETWLLYAHCLKKNSDIFGTFYLLFLKVGEQTKVVLGDSGRR